MRSRFPFAFAMASSIFLSFSLHGQVIMECSIVGEIRVVRGGFPNKRIEVDLETRGANLATAYSDNEGKFYFSNLEGNLYHIAINDTDYQPVNETVAVMPQVDCYKLIGITLTPKSEASASTAPPVRPGANAHMMDRPSQEENRVSLVGENPYLVDESDYTKRFPAKAVKEYRHGANADQKGEIDKAISFYEKALKASPEFYPARNNLGADYLNKGDVASAAREFEVVIKVHPDDAPARFNLGNAQFLMKQYHQAEQSIADGLQRDPNSALGFFLMGSLKSRTQQPLEAEKNLKRALELDPSMSKAHLALVNLFLQQQRKGEAISELQQFLKLAPNDALAPKVRDLLKGLEARSSDTVKVY